MLYMLSIWLNNRWTHALFWRFPICSAIFYCQHVIYMRTVWIIRYMLCICSACGQDMGKHVYIPATYIRHCRLIWLPYGIHMSVWYISFIYICYMLSIWLNNRWTHALFWRFPICSAIFYCQHVIYMRTVWIVRYMLCICSACGLDMGKHVYIPATYIRHCRPIWLPYGIHMCVWYISSIYLCYMLSIWLNNRWTHTLFRLFPICCGNILLPTCDLYEYSIHS